MLVLQQPENLEKVSMLKILIRWQRVANEPLRARAVHVEEQWHEARRAATGGREAYHSDHWRQSDAVICTDHRQRPSNGRPTHCARSASLASSSAAPICIFLVCVCRSIVVKVPPPVVPLCRGQKQHSGSNCHQATARLLRDYYSDSPSPPGPRARTEPLHASL